MGLEFIYLYASAIFLVVSTMEVELKNESDTRSESKNYTIKVYVLSDSSVTHHPKVRRSLCASRDCLVIELTFEDIYKALENSIHVLRRYVSEDTLKFFWDFYRLAEVATPDHIELEDKIFIVVENISKGYLDTYVHILFHHFEHDDPMSLIKILAQLTDLCRFTGCIEAWLEEMSSSAEYILFSLLYPSLGRNVDEKLRRQNPWRTLISSYLQEYYIQKGYTQHILDRSSEDKQRK